MNINSGNYSTIGFTVGHTGEFQTNIQRIAYVEKLFSFPVNRLISPKRVLIGEGVLTKICRRKPKLRHFFLFNDMLLYGRIVLNRKVLRSPQVIELIDVSIKDLDDNGIYRNGFSILSPRKSFTVYASTPEEKAHWIGYLTRCITEAQSAAGPERRDSVKKSPVWIPDCEATHCMVCLIAEFNLTHRRHHCRHCGKLVCHKCSPYRWMLPYQGSSRVRVCRLCHDLLQADKLRRNEQDQGKLTVVEQSNEMKLFDDLATPPNSSTNADKLFSESVSCIAPTFLGNANANDDLDTESDTGSETTEEGIKM